MAAFLSNLLPDSARALEVRKLKLAMKLGGTYRLFDVGRRHVEKLGAEVGLADSLERARGLAAASPDAASAVAERLTDDALEPSLVSTLAGRLADRAADCARRLR